MQLPSIQRPTFLPPGAADQPQDFSLPSLANRGIGFIADASAEALGFVIASLAVRIFVPSFGAPLMGIAIGLFAGKLVIKTLTSYNSVALMDLTYGACQLGERYPKLQTISFLFAMGVSLLSRPLGLAAGIAIGAYGAAILDVENYKLMQKASRKALLEKG